MDSSTSLDTVITLQTLLSTGIIGAIASVFIEALNRNFSSSPTTSKAITVILCLVVAGVYAWLETTPYLATVGIVLSAASLVYAFVYNKKQ